MDEQNGVTERESQALDNKEVLDRYNEKKKLFLIISCVIFFVTLFLYSPNSDTSFLPLTSFPFLAVFAVALAWAFFLMSTLIYIEFYTPPGSIPFPSIRKYIRPRNSPYENQISKDEYFSSSKDWGWHNDSTNPASQIYHDIHRNN